METIYPSVIFAVITNTFEETVVETSVALTTPSKERKEKTHEQIKGNQYIPLQFHSTCYLRRFNDL